MRLWRPERGALLAMAFACATAGAGCGPDADDYPLLRPDAGPPDPDALLGEGGAPADNFIEDDPLEDWDTSAAGPLSGIFALEVTTTANVIIDLEVRQVYRFRLLQDGASLRVRSQMCRLKLPVVEGLAELTVPLALELLIRSKDSDETGAFLSSEEPIGATFTPKPLFLVLGAELASPDVDPLPTADAPASAFDEDGDGEPGITLAAEVVFCQKPEEAYAALRTGATMTGTVEDLDTISGSVEPSLEQSVLGISDECLAAGTDLPIEIVPGATFRAVRVGEELDLNANGNVTCGEIVEAAPSLFGAYWETKE